MTYYLKGTYKPVGGRSYRFTFHTFQGNTLKKDSCVFNGDNIKQLLPSKTDGLVKIIREEIKGKRMYVTITGRDGKINRWVPKSEVINYQIWLGKDKK